MANKIYDDERVGGGLDRQPDQAEDSNGIPAAADNAAPSRDAGAQAEVDQLEAALRDSPDAPPAGDNRPPSSDPAAQAEIDQLNSLWRDSPDTESKGRFRAIFGGKKAIAWVTSALLIGGAGTLGFLTMGPGQFLQFSNFLQQVHISDQESLAAERLRNLFIYSQIARTGSGDLERTRLGIVNNSYADHVEKKLSNQGLKFIYDNGRFRGMEFDISRTPPNHPLRTELRGVTDTDSRNRIIAKYFEVPSVSGSGRNIVISVDSVKSSRKLISRALDVSPDYNKVTAAHVSRILYERANVTRNFPTRIVEGAKQKAADARKQRLAGKAQLDLPETRQTQSDDNLSEEQRNKAADYRNQTDSAIREIKTTGRLPNIAARTGTAVVAVIGLACAVRDVSGTASTVQQLNKVVPMIQSSNEILVIASKIQAGDDVDLEYLGYINESLNGTGENKSSWYDATSIQYESGAVRDVNNRTFDTFTELNPDGTSTVKSIDEFFATLEASVGPAIRGVCGVFGFIDNVTNALVSAIPLVGDIYNELQKIISGAVIGLLAGAPIDLTDPRYAGEAYGEAVSVGTLLAANETAATQGGYPLNTATALQLRNESQRYFAQTDDRPFLAKALDTTQFNSPAGKAVIALHKNSSAQNFASLFTNPLRVFSSLFGGRALAQEQQASNLEQAYYGIPKVGFNTSVINREQFEDPYENAAWVARNISPDSDIVKKFEKCAGIDVTSDFDFQTLPYDDQGGGMLADRYNEVQNDPDCTQATLESNEAMYRLRVLALDTSLLKSATCTTLVDTSNCINTGTGTNGEEDSGDSPEFSTCTEDQKKTVKNEVYWPTTSRNTGTSTHDISVTNQPVYAIKAGVVKISEDKIAPCDSTPTNPRKCNEGMVSYGRHIAIDHGIAGYSVINYAHLSKRLVKEGDPVVAGQLIGISGESGNAWGAHLHVDFDGDNANDTIGWLRSNNAKDAPRNGTCGQAAWMMFIPKGRIWA